MKISDNVADEILRPEFGLRTKSDLFYQVTDCLKFLSKLDHFTRAMREDERDPDFCETCCSLEHKKCLSCFWSLACISRQHRFSDISTVHHRSIWLQVKLLIVYLLFKSFCYIVRRLNLSLQYLVAEIFFVESRNIQNRICFLISSRK